MPTFSQMDIYPPINWDEFETIVRDVFQMEYSDVYFQKYGRQGQMQYGVDVCGIGQVTPRVIGVQCKNYEQNLSKLQIEEEIAKAETFKPRITEYFIVTKLKQDAKIQSIVYQISQERVAANKFPVVLLFWEGIKQSLSKFPELIAKHYPQFKKEINNLNYCALLDLSFYGGNLAMYSEIFLNPLNNQISHLVTLCNRLMNATIFIRNLDSRRMLEIKLNGLINYLNKYDNVFVMMDTKSVEIVAKEIENIIQSIEGNLANTENVIYNLGRLLAAWESNIFFYDKPIKKESILFFQDLLKKVPMPEYLAAQIQEKIKNINNIEEGKLNATRLNIPEIIIILINRSFSIA